jgi:hypothetical protein
MGSRFVLNHGIWSLWDSVGRMIVPVPWEGSDVADTNMWPIVARRPSSKIGSPSEAFRAQVKSV